MASSVHLKIPQLKNSGPICTVILKPSLPAIQALKLKKQKVPVYKARALIDTGASHTAVNRDIVKYLQLVPRGTVQVHTSSRTSEIRNEYDLSLKFDTQLCIEVLRVLEANLPDQRIDCLIGRDVLQFCTLTYDGKKKEIRLRF
jgi:predicted aspartyl protease